MRMRPKRAVMLASHHCSKVARKVKSSPVGANVTSSTSNLPVMSLQPALPPVTSSPGVPAGRNAAGPLGGRNRRRAVAGGAAMSRDQRALLPGRRVGEIAPCCARVNTGSRRRGECHRRRRWVRLMCTEVPDVGSSSIPRMVTLGVVAGTRDEWAEERWHRASQWLECGTNRDLALALNASAVTRIARQRAAPATCR